MSSDVEPSDPVKSRKRAREDDSPEDNSLLPKPKQRYSQFKSSASSAQRDPTLPTPPSTASAKYKDTQALSKAGGPSFKALAQPEPIPYKRPREQGEDDAPSTAKRLCGQSLSKRSKSWLDVWIENECRLISAQQAANALKIMPTTETAEDYKQMAQQQSDAVDSQSVQSERLNTSNPMFRGLLRANGISIDNSGKKIPRAVQELVIKHIQRQRDSPKLGEEQVDKIIKLVEKVWDSAEPKVSDLVNGPLFPLEHDELEEGRDLLWSTLPIRQAGKSKYPYALPAPKTDRHYGFPPTLKSTWSWEELGAADHADVRPFSQPTRENIFPSFLIEVKAESSRGTLYGAEGQLAVSGYHCVRSWLYVLDQVFPDRECKATDAMVFSCAVSQREAVAHVHYYNPDDNVYYMSFVDSFYYVRDSQECVDYIKNVKDWLVKIQQPIIRDALAKFHPLTLLWKKRKSDASESFGSEGGRSRKGPRSNTGKSRSQSQSQSQRTGPL